MQCVKIKRVEFENSAASNDQYGKSQVQMLSKSVGGSLKRCPNRFVTLKCHLLPKSEVFSVLLLNNSNNSLVCSVNDSLF